MLGAHSSSALRGDYSRARADYSVDQDLAGYSETDRTVWRRLIERQTATVRSHACVDYLRGLESLAGSRDIPDLNRASDFIARRTGWRLVAVPGFIPDEAFFEHLAARRFPVSVWVRKPQEIDYLVEPDLFHDFFGHVPLLLHPVFADYLAAYGAKGCEAVRMQALPRLARLYWYMVEFGLIDTADGLKAYGAGMLSSRAETVYSVTSPRPLRLWFDFDRVMRTRYMIDDFQKCYFVLRDFEQLYAVMAEDFAPRYARLSELAEIDPESLLPEDGLYAGASACNSGAASANAARPAQAASTRRRRG